MALALRLLLLHDVVDQLHVHVDAELPEVVEGVLNFVLFVHLVEGWSVELINLIIIIAVNRNNRLIIVSAFIFLCEASFADIMPTL